MARYKKKAAGGQAGPGTPPDPGSPGIRLCLWCQKPFLSTDAGNRKCPRHRADQRDPGPTVYRTADAGCW